MDSGGFHHLILDLSDTTRLGGADVILLVGPAGVVAGNCGNSISRSLSVGPLSIDSKT